MERLLEEMGSFFDTRIEYYEDHMKTEVDGAVQAYNQIAQYIPVKKGLKLVDLGCGTGLELERIYENIPDMKVTGIDLSREMLSKLLIKFRGKGITIHNMSYFDFDFGIERFEAAISCMTLHHFSHEDKVLLYTKLCNGIVQGGRYVECDYMALNQEMEDFYYSENKRIREEHGITEGYYHYDTPCTVENQINMLLQAGFIKVEKVLQIGRTAILVCDK
jgi:cyclopropane fatty-acyl-phospholipid synthase-like methyltransferase